MWKKDELSENLIERYLRGQLNEADTQALELRMLDDDAFLAEVQAAEQLRQALRGQECARPAAVQAVQLSERRNMLAAWLRQPLSLAASLLLALSPSFHLLPDASETPSGVLLPIESFAMLEPLRGNEDSRLFTGPGPHLLQVDAGFERRPQNLVLSAADGSLRQELDAITPDADGWLRLLLPAGLAGEYLLEMRGADDAARHYRLLFQTP